MKQIVCISTANWYPFPTRKQNVMKRLHDAEIIYFEPPVSVIAPLKDKSTFRRLFLFLKKGVRVKENINVYAIPPVLPFYYKYRIINRINQFFLSLYIKKRIQRAGFNNPVLWIYTPTAADLIGRLNKSAIVYDCVDRHSAYKGFIDEKTVDRMEEDLAKSADMVFSTAVGLHETLKKYNKNALMIPNGAAVEIFSKAADKSLKTPPDMEGIKHPVFGFVGMLQECIDYEAIEALAKSHNDATIVFIGRPLPGVNIDYLKKYENIRFLGLKPQEDLPYYMAHFDVCLNPFKEGALSKDVSPLKFYEYLSTGLPIVTMKEPLQVLDFSEVVYIAENRDDFVFKCGKAAGERDEGLRKKRIKLSIECSWDSRVLRMEEELKARNIL